MGHFIVVQHVVSGSLPRCWRLDVFASPKRSKDKKQRSEGTKKKRRRRRLEQKRQQLLCQIKPETSRDVPRRPETSPDVPVVWCRTLVASIQVNLFGPQICRFTTKGVNGTFCRFCYFLATLCLRGKMAHVMAKLARFLLHTAAISRNHGMRGTVPPGHPC